MTATGKEDLLRSAARVYAYLSQGEMWKPKDRPALPVSEMDESWRRNAARWMERRAGYFEFLYSTGEAAALGAPVYVDVVGEKDGRAYVGGAALSELDLMSDAAMDDYDRWVDERSGDPVAWVRTTPLYRALVDGLAGGES
jgi:hypothetical protein